MGIMIIAAFLAYLLWKAIYKKAPAFITAGVVTFMVLLGFMMGLTYPFSYGNAEIVESHNLKPVKDNEIYLEIIDNEYHYQTDRIGKKIDGTSEDIRVTYSELYTINYCVEYPKVSIMSFGLLNSPRYYYEILVPEEAITYPS